MLFYASKVLPLFVYPLGLSLILVAIAVMMPRRPGTRRLLCIAAFLILAAFSSDFVSQALVHSLESQTPVRTVEDLPVVQAIVVLGGYLHPPGGSNKTLDFSEACDRLLHGMRLYRARKAPLILLTGGNIPFMGSARMSEAAAARDILREWGVPAESILLDEQSFNTEENARYSYRILSAKGIRRILLVTSAFHMPRSQAVFRKAGFDSVPAPTDFRSGWGQPDVLFQWLPDPEHLYLSTTALKEWLGLGIYRLRGWT